MVTGTKLKESLMTDTENRKWLEVYW